MDENLSFNRFKPRQLVYVELDASNGGMLLSASEEGFCIRCVAPLKASGPVAFALLLDGKTRLEGKGKLVWSEEEGRRCGIFFTEVTPQFRREFESWLRKKEGRRSAESEEREEAAPAALPHQEPRPVPAGQEPARKAVTTAPAAPAVPEVPARGAVEEDASRKARLEALAKALDKEAQRQVSPPRSSVAPPIPAAELPHASVGRPRDGISDSTREETAPLTDRSKEIAPRTEPQKNAAEATAVPPSITPAAEERPSPISMSTAPPIFEPAKTLREEEKECREPVEIKDGKGAKEAKEVKEADAVVAEDPLQRVAQGFRLGLADEKKAPKLEAPLVAEMLLSGDTWTSLPSVPFKTAAKGHVSTAEKASMAPAAAKPRAVVQEVAPNRETPETGAPKAATTIAQPAEKQEVSKQISQPGEQEESFARSATEASTEETLGETERDLAKEVHAQNGSRKGRVAATIFVALVIVAVIVVLGMDFRRPIGEKLIELGQKLAGENVPAEERAGPVLGEEKSAPALSHARQARGAHGGTSGLDAVPTPGLAAGGTTAATAGAGAAAKSTQNKPEDSASGAGGAKPSATAVPATTSADGSAEFEAARKILHGNNRDRDMEHAVELLVASVSRGYAPAEVTLGDLYVRGDGVPKDCDQARLLLQSAERKGSPEARRMLGQLKSAGCP